MLEKLFKLKTYIPNEYHKTVYDINLIKLKEKGFKYLFCDLDNTLDPYSNLVPSDSVKKFKEDVLNIGLKLILISNNHRNRVKKYALELGVPHLSGAKKPLLVGFKKLLKTFEINKDDIVVIGDQIMTDILGGNRLGAYTIFIDSIDKLGESWYTRFNRRKETKILNKVKSVYPEEYSRIMSIYEKGE